MGDRANLQFRSENQTIGIYGHWVGTDIAKAAVAVVESPTFQKRVGDDAYATRIGVQIALKELGSDEEDEHGFGLYVGNECPDNDGYEIVVVNVDTGKIEVDGEVFDKPTAATVAKAMQGR